jgi:GTPase involved in cell partitioning and DNA repair
VLEAQAEVVGELDEAGQQLLVAAGGRGGLGNTAFSSKPYGPASRCAASVRLFGLAFVQLQQGLLF